MWRSRATRNGALAEKAADHPIQRPITSLVAQTGADRQFTRHANPATFETCCTFARANPATLSIVTIMVTGLG